MKKLFKNNYFSSFCGLITFLIVFYWLWLFYVTQQATELNTYTYSEKILSIEISPAFHRGNDKLYIQTSNHYCMLDTGWRNMNKSNELATIILLNDQNSIIRLWKRIPKNFAEINKNGLEVWQVVDIRINESTYWDILDHNDFQKSERISGIVIGIFLSFVVCFFDWLVWLAFR